MQKLPKHETVYITNCTNHTKAESKKAWPFRYAERFSGTSPPLADLLFLAMKKSKSRSRLERQSQAVVEF